MRQRWTWTICAALSIGAIGSICHAAALVPQSQARRCGLKRVWFAQVGSLQSTGPVNHIQYSSGLILAQTAGGMLTALDAETGRTLWSVQVGPRGRQTTEASANERYVAAVNGSSLYVLDRANGDVLWQRRLGGAPGAGPAVSETHAFTPMVDGTIEGYALDGSDKGSPWIYKSSGSVSTPPMATPQSVSWTTERGYFYVANPAAEGIRYRLETNNAIHGRPGYWTPNLYAGSTDGSVYGVDEASGQLRWKYAVGDAIFEPPVAVESKLFAVAQFRGMICLDTNGPTELWVAPGIAQFVSASPTRVYTRDKVERLVVLDIETGARLASMPLVDVAHLLTNPHSDRIYLVGETGAVQCLHEIGRPSPVLHIPPAPPKTEQPAMPRRESVEPASEPTDAPLPAEEPFPAEEPPMEDNSDEPTPDFDADDPFATP